MARAAARPHRRAAREWRPGDGGRVDAAKLDASFLARELTPELVAELEAGGADACGEEGEYHTMVTAAPLFAAPGPLAWGGREERDGHWVLKFTTVEAT